MKIPRFLLSSIITALFLVPIQAYSSISVDSVPVPGTDGLIKLNMSDDGVAVLVNSYEKCIINQWGEVVVPFGKYYNLDSYYSDGLIQFTTEDFETGWIDSRGNEVIPAQAGIKDTPLGGCRFTNGINAIQLGEMYVLIDRTGKTIFETELVPYEINGDCVIVRDNNTKLFGAIDLSGNVIIPIQYNRAIGYYNDIIILYQGAQKMLFDTDGHCLLVLDNKYDEVDATPFHDTGLIIVRDENYRAGLIDVFGNEIVPCTYTQLLYGDGGFVAITPEQRFGIIDSTGNLVVPCEYDYIYPFSDGLALAMSETNTEKWCYFDCHGQAVLVLPAEFNTGWAHDFEDGTARISDGYTMIQYVLDKSGTIYELDELISCSGFQDGLATDPLTASDFQLYLNPLRKTQSSPWATSILENADAADLISESNDGYYTFRTTRRRFAELMVCLVEKATGETLSPADETHFSDTADLAVRKAAKAGLVSGTGDGTFLPNVYITREEVAVMLRTAAKYIESHTGASILTPSQGLSKYTDANQVSSWAEDAVGSLIASGIMAGTSDSTISPLGTATVEQTIALSLQIYNRAT